MEKISATIITFNEEKNIERCLKSLELVADEIIVVDSFSTDKTKEICQKLNIKNLTFLENKFEGHIQQKNFAKSFSKYKYTISLDADEKLSDSLIKEIIYLKKNEFKYNAYSFNRLTSYNGKWIKHCGWYPDKKVRLFNNKLFNWGGENPHDKIITNGDLVKHIPKDILHYSYHSISEHIIQTDKFTTIAARNDFKKGLKSSYFKIYTRPFFKFIRDYIFKRGFLDGRYGLVVCFINSLYPLLKYSKLKDLQENKRI